MTVDRVAYLAEEAWLKGAKAKIAEWCASDQDGSDLISGTFNHTYASAIVGAQKTHARKAADFYPTPPDVTEALLTFLDLNPGEYIWEPACGDGAMAKILARDHNVAATDLRDDCGYGTGGVDFLTATDDSHSNIADWIITNPPFKLAVQFIEKSLSITPNVAMLLKSQFWHARRREELFRKHPPAWILPLTWRPAFLEAERGSSPLMDVIWVVWRGAATETRFRPINRPPSAQIRRINHSVQTTPAHDINDDLADLIG